MDVYTQSRFYRAPEVLLGIRYECSLDMWSLGCILVEMYSGKVLFEGRDKEEQIVKHVEVLDIPPADVIQRSLKGKRYFECKVDENKSIWQLKPQYSIKERRTLREALGERFDPNNAQCIQFESLILQMLDYNQHIRIKPHEARRHPFFSLQAISVLPQITKLPQPLQLLPSITPALVQTTLPSSS